MANTKVNSVPEEQVGIPIAEDAEKKTSPEAAPEAAAGEPEKPVRKRSVKKTAEPVSASAKEKPVKTTSKVASVKAEVAPESDPEAVEAADAVEKKAPAKKAAAKKTAGSAGTVAKAPGAEEPVAAEAGETVAPKAQVAKKTAADKEADEEEGIAETVQEDFAEEDAALAASAPEFDMGEESDDEAGQTASGDADYAGKSKEELVAAMELLLKERPVQSIRRDVEQIKIAFYKLHKAQVDQLRKTFSDEGGLAEEFVAPADAQEQRLKELFAEYRRKRDEYIATLESQKEENYKAKLQVIEELKELVNGGETMDHTFAAFRDLQRRWKEAGVVPQAVVKDLWETYNLHVENFYNFIKINKELRDLDLKKNYEAKTQLCEEAEALILEPSVVVAFNKLQKLHEQWRETGPVAVEYKDQLWERFREASSKINKKHQEYYDNIKEEQRRNLELKTELCVKTEELAALSSTSRKEWNKASDKLIEIQKVWKTIGFAPKKDNARIYERFRVACDRFFENKRNFYMQLKAEMEENLNLKNEVCALAEQLRESEEWKKTTEELIALQKRWKEIGPVSRRYSDAVWKRFRSACDEFFERKAKFFSAIDSKYEENLEKKRALMKEISDFVFEEKEKGFEALKEFQRRWTEIGFVPIRQKEAIQNEYRKLIDGVFAKLRGGERERSMDRFRGKISNFKESNNTGRLRHERDRLYNKVKQLESDIALLENNIGFFSKSKNAEAMIRDVRNKIDRAKEEMAQAINKINLIDQGETKHNGSKTEE